MIPVEKLRALKHIIVHDKCGDGMASAMILKWCFPHADVDFVQYDKKKHRTLPVRPDTVFADFSPHAEQVKAFLQAEAVVLDHHKTQKQVVAEFGELGVFGDEDTEPGVSGAVLAFREVFRPLIRDKGLPIERQLQVENTIEDFAILAGIRDTWQNKDPRWHEANELNAALTFWPAENLLGLDPASWGEKLSLGPILYQRRLDWAKQCGDESWRITTPAGTKCAIFEGLKAASDVAEYLDDTDIDLVFAFDVFLVDGVPAMVCTTRSHTDFDCGAFAKSYGGGGHTRAAGFKHLLQPDDPNPFYLAKRLIESYEGRDKPEG